MAIAPPADDTGSPDRGRTRRRTVVTEKALQQWLAKHDEGISFRQIANHFKVDRRTVEKHLPAALENRRWSRIRDEIDRGALEGHIAKIRDSARTLRGSLVLPRYGIEWTWTWPPDPDNLPMQEVLRAHFPLLPAWDRLAEWETRYAAYVSSCERLEAKIAREVERRKWTAEATIGLLHQALPRAQGVQPPETTAYSGLRGVPWEAALKRLMASEEADQVRSEWAHLSGLQAELQEALTEIAFKVRIPGECRFCAP